MATDNIASTNEQQTVNPLQRQWPQLGKELYSLERALAAHFVTYGHSLSENEKMERSERFRNRVFAQLYNDDEKYSPETRYRAFLVVKNGKAGEIVGNPYCVDAHGQKQILPYTGLEGYYAGSIKTSAYPGMSPEKVVQEEAYIGVEMLKSIKKHAIERYTWASFAKMKKGLESGEPDIEDLKTIEILWAEVVRRLHVRVYDNPEFEMTVTEQYEQLEKLISIAPVRTEEEKAYKAVLEAEYNRLKNEIHNMSEVKKEQERQKRKERERIRRERLKAYNHFRDSTYAMLKETGNGDYEIEVNDSQWSNANIIETILLPKTQDKEDYDLTRVTLTPEQVEGYMFLTELGDIGGDPLARTVLSSTQQG
ncbi:MAG TPA: hypothetical protein VE843_16025 [Ktedonobacteraceae bacterium]|nr:hypothetical protein [Ktedonobacteraceae bacterium]